MISEMARISDLLRVGRRWEVMYNLINLLNLINW